MQHERDFGAIEANAVDSATQLFFMFRAEARIEHHLHALAAFQLCWLVDVVFRQAAQLNFFTDKTLVFLDQYRFRIDQQFTAITVHHQRTAMQHRRLDIGPHNGRDTQRTHHNCRMRVGCAVPDNHAN